MSALLITSQKSEKGRSNLACLEVVSLVAGCEGLDVNLLSYPDRCIVCPVRVDADLEQQKLALEGLFNSARGCRPTLIGLFAGIALVHLKSLAKLSIDDRCMERLLQAQEFGLRLQAVLASAFDLPTVRNLSERVVLITQKSFLSYPSIGIGEWQLSGRVTPA